jgi:hypothetical protein
LSTPTRQRAAAACRHRGLRQRRRHYLHRLPSGNDFALRARASVGSDGIGVTTAEVFDQAGFIGTAAQTLLIQRR